MLVMEMEVGLMGLTFDGLDVGIAVLELLADVSLVGVKDVGTGLAVCLGERRRPTSVANTSSEVTRESVLLGGIQVKIMSTSRAVVVEEGVLKGLVAVVH